MIFSIFILFNKVSYNKLNFKLKVDSKMCTFKNLEEILKIGKKKRVETLFITDLQFENLICSKTV